MRQSRTSTATPALLVSTKLRRWSTLWWRKTPTGASSTPNWWKICRRRSPQLLWTIIIIRRTVKRRGMCCQLVVPKEQATCRGERLKMYEKVDMVNCQWNMVKSHFHSFLQTCLSFLKVLTVWSDSCVHLCTKMLIFSISAVWTFWHKHDMWMFLLSFWHILFLKSCSAYLILYNSRHCEAKLFFLKIKRWTSDFHQMSRLMFNSSIYWMEFKLISNVQTPQSWWKRDILIK